MQHDDNAARAAVDRESLLHTVAELVFRCLPLSIQAIAVPALSKGWQQWEQEEPARERTLQEAERVWFPGLRDSVVVFPVPLWAAQQKQPTLSDDEKRRFQLRAVVHGDVGAAEWCGGVGSDVAHHRRLCELAAAFGRRPAGGTYCGRLSPACTEWLGPGRGSPSLMALPSPPGLIDRDSD